MLRLIVDLATPPLKSQAEADEVLAATASSLRQCMWLKCLDVTVVAVDFDKQQPIPF